MYLAGTLPYGADADIPLTVAPITYASEPGAQPGGGGGAAIYNASPTMTDGVVPTPLTSPRSEFRGPSYSVSYNDCGDYGYDGVLTTMRNRGWRDVDSLMNGGYEVQPKSAVPGALLALGAGLALLAVSGGRR
jgi:hypothetical protein